MRQPDLPPFWPRDDAAQAQVLARRFEALLKSGDSAAVLAAIRDWPPADILSCLMRMRPKRARTLFALLPEATGLPVLAQLDPDLRQVLWDAASHPRFRKLVHKLDPDRALEMLEPLPDDMARDLIRGHPQADRLRQAQAANRDSAAAHMRHGVMIVPMAWTVAQVIADLRVRHSDIPQLDMIFAVDGDQRLVGYVRPRDLLLSPGETPLAPLLRDDALVVDGRADQEDVLHLAEARGARILAVTDGQGRVLGGIAPPELAEILREESEEDLLKLGGVSPASSQFDAPVQIVRRRLPWLLGGLIGASVAAMGIVSYEDALAESAILASFIPVVLATAGNAGIQASTVSVQVLTSGHNWQGDLPGRVLRELGGAALNGVLVGLVVACLALLGSLVIDIRAPGLLALTATIALTLVTTIAAGMGTLVPFALRALRLDPAAATGIFITTTNDVFGVLTFFTVASVIYL